MFLISSVRFVGRRKIINRIATMASIQPSDTFNPESVKQTLNVVGMKTNATEVQKVMKLFERSILKRTAVKSVTACTEDASKRIILMDPNKFPPLQDLPGGLSSEDKDSLQKIKDAEFVPQEVELGFPSFSTEDILAKLLPPEVTPVRSFEGIGHIAHLNLRDEHMPYKSIIGQVIMAKNPSIKTVVTKVGNISTKFRTFDMEVIAGEDNTETVVGEGGFKFRLDFRKVYWNSRLGTEHNELATSFCSRDVVCEYISRYIIQFY